MTGPDERALGDPEWRFGTYRLLPASRLLFDADRAVRLGSRAFDILGLLVERAGEVVSHKEIFARAWGTTIVNEANIRAQIAGLRKVLAGGHNNQSLIANISGRGYQFVAPVMRGQSALRNSSAPSKLPALLARLFGRAEAITTVRAWLRSERLVTIVGPGGIGKTTLALAVAQEFATDQSWFVDVASVSDEAGVPAVLASSMGLPVTSDDVLSALRSFLRSKSALIVLDNCEHVVGACASLTEILLGAAPNLRVLATSREPLRVGGEHVWRLAPLEIPPPESGMAEAMHYAAVELFVDRATARTDSFKLSEAATPVVIEICRRLDGIPFAIEIAAALVARLGLRQILDYFDDRMGGPVPQRGNDPRRHATLTAVLEWSYKLLSEFERQLLRRLSVFRGRFYLSSAIATVPEVNGSGADAVLEALCSLAEKSLINVDLSGEHVRYSLLNTTRAFAIAKMDSAESRVARIRHAQQQLVLIREAESGWVANRRSDSMELYEQIIDDIRAGLDWALSAEGDLEICAALIVESMPAWFRLSLSFECQERASKVLDRVRGWSDRDTEMRLRGVHATAMGYHLGGVLAGAAYAELYSLAVAQQDVRHQMLATWGLWFFEVYTGRIRQAAVRAARFSDLSRSTDNLANTAMASFMRAQSAFLIGQMDDARTQANQALDLFTHSPNADPVIKYQVNPVVQVRELRSRIFWLQGNSDQATAEVNACVQEARADGHGITISFSLIEAGAQIALLNGDLDVAADAIDAHWHNADSHSFGSRIFFNNSALLSALLAARGDLVAAKPLLMAALDGGPTRFPSRFPALIGRLAEALAACSSVLIGLSAIEAALTGIASDPDHWCRPELFRAQSCILLASEGAAAAGQAEAGLRIAYEQSKAQRSLAWELRIAINLAELRQLQGQRNLAAATLEATLDCFKEGFATADYLRARSLYRALTETN